MQSGSVVGVEDGCVFILLHKMMKNVNKIKCCFIVVVFE